MKNTWHSRRVRQFRTPSFHSSFVSKISPQMGGQLRDGLTRFVQKFITEWLVFCENLLKSDLQLKRSKIPTELGDSRRYVPDVRLCSLFITSFKNFQKSRPYLCDGAENLQYAASIMAEVYFFIPFYFFNVSFLHFFFFFWLALFASARTVRYYTL